MLGNALEPPCRLALLSYIKITSMLLGRSSMIMRRETAIHVMVQDKRIAYVAVFAHVLSVVVRVPTITDVQRQLGDSRARASANCLDRINIKALQTAVVLRLVHELKTNHIVILTNSFSKCGKNLDC